MVSLQQLRKIFSCVDMNKDNYINELREAVEIKSVSKDPECRDEVVSMLEWFSDRLKKAGFKTELCDLGQKDDLKLPPVLTASFKGTTSSKKTILFYGHADVEPANRSDGWYTEPFEVHERADKLYGRGTSDNKGPVLCWINAVTAYRYSEIDLPVHIKFVIEAMACSFSEGLLNLMEKKKDFLRDVDYICISKGSWVDKVKPSLTFGFRGLAYFAVEIECSKKILDSGTFGGILNEGMSDMVYLLGTLTDKEGKILIPGIYTDVAKLTTQEDEAMERIGVNFYRVKESKGIKKLLYKEDKVKILHHAWRFPSLTIHGIDNVNTRAGDSLQIPARIVGRFSLRIVPNQTTKRVEKLTADYLKAKWKERGSGNDMRVTMIHKGEPWVTDPEAPYFEAARKAVRLVYEVEPDFIRMGGSILIGPMLAESSKGQLVVLPIGAIDDDGGGLNEKLDVRNYLYGTKLVTAFLSEISVVPA